MADLLPAQATSRTDLEGPAPAADGLMLMSMIPLVLAKEVLSS